MTNDAWEKWKVREAATSWARWCLGIFGFLVVHSLVVGGFDLIGFGEWSAWPALAIILVLTVARLVARRGDI